MHWTEHPVYFQKTLDKYGANDSIVFDGIHFLHVFIWLMRKRYDLLAKNFVSLDNKYPTFQRSGNFFEIAHAKIPARFKRVGVLTLIGDFSITV